MANALIDITLEEIAKGYQPGTLLWMKVNRPEDWKKMVGLETMINQRGLTGDTEGLKKALIDYRDLLKGLTKDFTSRGE